MGSDGRPRRRGVAVSLLWATLYTRDFTATQDASSTPHPPTIRSLTTPHLLRGPPRASCVIIAKPTYTPLPEPYPKSPLCAATTQRESPPPVPVPVLQARRRTARARPVSEQQRPVYPPVLARLILASRCTLSIRSNATNVPARGELPAAIVLVAYGGRLRILRAGWWIGPSGSWR